MFCFKEKHTFYNCNLTLLFLYSLVIKFCLSWLLGNIISSAFPNQLSHSFSNLPAYESFAAVVLFAPIFETFIFQFIIFYLGDKLRLKNSLIIIIASILFAISHHTSLAYIVFALFSGLFYNIIYLNIKKEHKTGIAILFIIGIHAIYNFVVWLNVELIK